MFDEKDLEQVEFELLKLYLLNIGDSEITEEIINEIIRVNKIKNSIENYDKEIREIEDKIEEYEDYVKDHPERIGMKGNISTLKHVKNVLIESRKMNYG